MSEYQTVFASLKDYTKGSLEIVNDNPKHYVFSNMFEVASMSKPWEKVAVAKNMEYVLEAIRADEAASGPFDLVLFGNESADTGAYQTGLRVARALGQRRLVGPFGPAVREAAARGVPAASKGPVVGGATPIPSTDASGAESGAPRGGRSGHLQPPT